MDVIDSGDAYGVKKTGSVVAGGALKGAAAGAALGPIGMGVGALVGVAGGLLGNKKAKQERNRTTAKSMENMATKNRLLSDSIMAADPTAVTGRQDAQMYKYGGTLKGTHATTFKLPSSLASIPKVDLLPDVTVSPGRMAKFATGGKIGEGKPKYGGDLGGKASADSLVDQQGRMFWNGFIDHIDSKGYKGSPKLDERSTGLSRQLFDDYAKGSPYTYDEFVPKVQRSFAKYRSNVIELHKAGKAHLNGRKVSTEEELAGFMSDLSNIDGWAGSKTTSRRFAREEILDKKTRKSTGKPNDAYSRSKLKYGGQMVPIAQGSFEVKGPSHAEGGVKIPELGVELEGGETVSDGFVFSKKLGFADLHKPIANAIAKTEKMPNTPSARKTLQALTGQESRLKVKQETTKQQLGIPTSLTKMANGGKIDSTYLKAEKKAWADDANFRAPNIPQDPKGKAKGRTEHLDRMAEALPVKATKLKSVPKKSYYKSNFRSFFNNTWSGSKKPAPKSMLENDKVKSAGPLTRSLAEASKFRAPNINLPKSSEVRKNKPAAPVSSASTSPVRWDQSKTMITRFSEGAKAAKKPVSVKQKSLGRKSAIGDGSVIGNWGAGVLNRLNGTVPPKSNKSPEEEEDSYYKQLWNINSKPSKSNKSPVPSTKGLTIPSSLEGKATTPTPAAKTGNTKSSTGKSGKSGKSSSRRSTSSETIPREDFTKGAEMQTIGVKPSANPVNPTLKDMVPYGLRMNLAEAQKKYGAKEGKTGLKGLADKVTPFVSNIVNAFRKLPNPPTPKLQSGVTPSLINMDADRAENVRQRRGADKAAEANLNGGNAVSATRAANLAQEMRANNQISQAEANANTGIKNQFQQLNANIQANNLAKEEQYETQKVERRIKQQELSAENLADVSNKSQVLARDQKLFDLEQDKLMIKIAEDPTGAGFRINRAVLKKKLSPQAYAELEAENKKKEQDSLKETAALRKTTAGNPALPSTLLK